MKWADLMAANGHLRWPSVGSFVTAYGQFFMAADIDQRQERRECSMDGRLRYAWSVSLVRPYYGGMTDGAADGIAANLVRAVRTTCPPRRC